MKSALFHIGVLFTAVAPLHAMHRAAPFFRLHKVFNSRRFSTVPDNIGVHNMGSVWDAVHRGDPRSVRFLLELGVNSNMQCKRYKNQSGTLLGQALRGGRVWTGGCDPYVRYPSGGDYLSVIRLLLLYGACPNKRDNGFQEDSPEPLIDCPPLELTESPQVMIALLEHGADPMVRGKTGDSLIHWKHNWTNSHVEMIRSMFARDGDLSPDSLSIRVRSILAQGGDLDMQDNEGDTALHTCAKEGRMDDAELLYRYGASPLIRNHADKAPRECALNAGARARFRLMELRELEQEDVSAIRSKRIAFDAQCRLLRPEAGTLDERLLEKKIDVMSASEHGTTLLHWVVQRAIYGQDEEKWGNSLHALHYLLSHGADVNAQDAAGLTPLHWAVYRNEVGVIAMLLKFPKIAPTEENCTRAIEIAMRCASAEVVRELVIYAQEKNIVIINK